MQETEDPKQSAVKGSLLARLRKQLIHILEREGKPQERALGKERKRKNERIDNIIHLEMSESILKEVAKL